VSKQTDISQLIRKYLNGELDAHAMHQLEKEAQNDPFLMEALEGYEQSGIDQQHNLADIHKRLHDRTDKTERRIIPWRIISIAASIFIALTIGGLWLRDQSVVKSNKTIVKASKQLAPAAKPSNIDTVKTIIQQQPVAKLVAKNKPHKIRRTIVITTPNVNADALPAPVLASIKVPDTVSLGEVKVIGYGTQRKTSITGAVATIKRDDLSNYNKTSTNYQSTAKLAEVVIPKDKSKSIVGIVKDDSGQVLPGVTVKIKGTNIGSQTDAKGKFTLPATSYNATLDLAYIGYNQKQVTVNKRDSLVIAMQPNNNSLNEVVVVGYGTNKKQDDEQPVYESAHPVSGWGDFKKYLKDNAKSPDGKTGVVKVSFTVNEYGVLSDFKIKRSLSTETDNAAIQLIQNGPRWLTNTDRKPEVVKVRIRFTTK
jgi:TonB family protein